MSQSNDNNAHDNNNLSCSLAHAETRTRKQYVRTQVVPKILKQSKIENGISLSFKDTEKNRRLVDELIEYESQCCGSIKFFISAKESKEFELKIVSASGIRLSLDMLNLENCLQGDADLINNKVKDANRNRLGIITIALGLVACAVCFLPILLAILGLGSAGILSEILEISPAVEGVGIVFLVIGVVILAASYFHRKNSNRACCSS